MKNHDQQNEKTIPEITIETTNKNKIYIGDEGTNVLNKSKDNLLVTEDNPSSDLDSEALEFYKLMPRQDGDLVEFILEYRKLRSKYSKEYLVLIIDRYKKSKELKGENIYHRPDNFFKSKEYVKYLDENWESILAECNKIAVGRQRKHSKKHPNEPQVSDEWDEQLKDLGW